MSANGKTRSESMLVFGRGQWMEAARMIVQPNNITGVPRSGFHTQNPSIAQKDVAFRGESLRSKRNPSVTELLVKTLLPRTPNAWINPKEWMRFVPGLKWLQSLINGRNSPLRLPPKF
jgi:hypothetical protein